MQIDDCKGFVCVVQAGLGTAGSGGDERLQVECTLLVDPVPALEPVSEARLGTKLHQVVVVSRAGECLVDLPAEVVAGDCDCASHEQRWSNLFHEIEGAPIKFGRFSRALRADKSFGQHETHVQQSRAEIGTRGFKVRKFGLHRCDGLASKNCSNVQMPPSLRHFVCKSLAIEHSLAESKGARPIAQMLPNCMTREMQKLD